MLARVVWQAAHQHEDSATAMASSMWEVGNHRYVRFIATAVIPDSTKRKMIVLRWCDADYRTISLEGVVWEWSMEFRQCLDGSLAPVTHKLNSKERQRISEIIELIVNERDFYAVDCARHAGSEQHMSESAAAYIRKRIVGPKVRRLDQEPFNLVVQCPSLEQHWQELQYSAEDIRRAALETWRPYIGLTMYEQLIGRLQQPEPPLPVDDGSCGVCFWDHSFAYCDVIALMTPEIFRRVIQHRQFWSKCWRRMNRPSPLGPALTHRRSNAAEHQHRNLRGRLVRASAAMGGLRSSVEWIRTTCHGSIVTLR